MVDSFAAAVRAPRMSELGYRNIALQQWRGMMATPRNIGWVPTIRSFIASHTRHKAAPETPRADSERR